MDRAKIVAILVVVTAVTLALLSLIVPTPSTWTAGWFELHITLVTSVLYTVLHIGAATLMLLGLHALRKQLKVAYISIAVGVILTSICLTQLPIVSILDLWESFWVKSGPATVPFLLGILGQYYGLRLWAKQLQINSFATKWRIVLPLTVVGIVALILLPHPQSPLPATELAFKLAVYGWILFLSIFSTMLVWQIRRTSGTSFTRAQVWLGMALIANTLVILWGTGMEWLGKPSYAFWLPENPIDELLVIAGLLYLRAGYLFNRLGVLADESTPKPTAAQGATPFDIILYLAQLTSRPQAIDQLLDPFRQITAVHEANAPLSEGDIKVLKSVFTQLEIYLTTKDPVRTFSNEALRAQLGHRFPPQLTNLFY